MTLLASNVKCGAVLLAVGGILLAQTFGTEALLVSEGIHPMDYPRFLIYALLGLGVLIAVQPTGDKPVVLFTPRTLGMVVTLLLYGAALEYLGFVMSSFLATCACSYVLGQRKLLLMLLTNSCGVVGIWALFQFVLKMPLPQCSFF